MKIGTKIGKKIGTKLGRNLDKIRMKYAKTKFESLIKDTKITKINNVKQCQATSSNVKQLTH